MATAAVAMAALVPSSATAAADEGWIYHTCTPNLCRVDADGGTRTQLTADGVTFAQYAGISASRDGRVLGFQTVFGEPLGMKVMVLRPAEGTVPSRIATDAALRDVSPDGTRASIVPSRRLDDLPGGCTVSTVDGGDRRCFTLPLHVAVDDLQDDGSFLGTFDPVPFSFAGVHEADRIVEVGADGAVRRTVATLPELGIQDPEVSPDGRSFVATVVGDLGVPSRVAVFDRATGTLRRYLSRLGTGPAPDGTGVLLQPSDDSPAWSPDGQSVVFHREHPGYVHELFVIAADGPIGSERSVGPGASPVWVPAVALPAAVRPGARPFPGRPLRLRWHRRRVRVSVAGAAALRLTVDRATTRRGRTTWRRTVSRTARAAAGGTVAISLGRRLAHGRYRVTVTARRNDGVATPRLRVVRRVR